MRGKGNELVELIKEIQSGTEGRHSFVGPARIFPSVILSSCLSLFIPPRQIITEKFPRVLIIMAVNA